MKRILQDFMKKKWYLEHSCLVDETFLSSDQRTSELHSRLTGFMLYNLSNAIDRIGWTINLHFGISNQIVRMQMQLYIFCGPLMSPNVFTKLSFAQRIGGFCQDSSEIHLLASAIFLMIGCFVLELQRRHHKF